ncbi:MAG: hypothetical protein ACKVP5_08810 [Aestuariivirga sp.]
MPSRMKFSDRVGLDGDPLRATVSELFDLGRSKKPTDISRHKHQMIADSIARAKQTVEGQGIPG